jgi:hypothetical protein
MTLLSAYAAAGRRNLGGLGGLVVEAYDTVAVLRATHRWPWLHTTKRSRTSERAARWNAFGIWATAVVLRIGAGGVTASAVASQITGELVAFALGVAGPLALERILALVPPTVDRSRLNATPPATTMALQGDRSSDAQHSDGTSPREATDAV